MNKRMNWLDISKGLAILLVVVGHVFEIPYEPYRKIIFSFHMPLFLIAAGYTAKPELSLQSIWKSFRRLFIPYLAAYLITGMVHLHLGSDWRTELMRLAWGSGVPATYGPGLPVTGITVFPEAGVLWFLPCLFFAKTLFCALLKTTNFWKEWQKAFAVLLTGVCGYLLGQRYKFPLGIDISLFSIVFLYAGYLFKKYNGIAHKSILMKIGFLFLWVIAIRNDGLELSARIYHPFPVCIWTTAGAIGATFLIFWLSHVILNRIVGIKQLLLYCGRHTLALLIIHHFVGLLWDYRWMNVLLPDALSFTGLMRGCVMVMDKICLYLLLCALYTFVHRVMKKGWQNHQKSLCHH